MVEAKALGAVVLAVGMGSMFSVRASVGATEPLADASRPASAQATATARQWKRLRSAAATATSFLQNDWSKYEENYHPSYALDDNPATAWVVGTEGFGQGESITLPLSPIRGARALRLRIWNGYQKSLRLWTKNAMPRDVDVTVLDAKGEEVETVRESLARVQEPQEFVIELPRGRGLAGVRLTIRSVHVGERFDDTCISDIAVDVDVDKRYSPAVEQAKAAALTAWISERKAVAAYFATKPRELPFAGRPTRDGRNPRPPAPAARPRRHGAR